MRSRFTGTEPYDGFAHAILPYAEYDRILLEYDDERSGGFGPLRHLREDAVAVLGHYHPKRGAMESADELVARIEEAARARSAAAARALECSAGSRRTRSATKIHASAQSAKMELVVDVATSVWGSV